MASNVVLNILNDENYKKCNFKSELSKIFFQDSNYLSIYDFMPDDGGEKVIPKEGEEFVEYNAMGQITQYALAKNNAEDKEYSSLEYYSYFDNGNVAEKIIFADTDGDGVFDNKIYIQNDEKTSSFVTLSDKNMDGIADSETYNIYNENNEFVKTYSKTDLNGDYKIDQISEERHENKTLIRLFDTDMDGKYDLKETLSKRAEDGELMDSKSEFLINVNGEIENSFQGETGDCWLLSAINSLNSTESGKKIINNAITINDDGSYDVNLSGVGRKYNFSEDELKKAREDKRYSSGDDDMLLFELAIEKDRKDFRFGNIISALITKITNKDVLQDGSLGDALRYFDESYGLFKSNNHFSDNLEEIEEIFADSSKDCAVGLNALIKKTDEEEIALKDISGNEVLLAKQPYNHGWSVISFDNDILTLINPTDSGKEIKINKDELKPYLESGVCKFNYVELKDEE